MPRRKAELLTWECAGVGRVTTRRLTKGRVKQLRRIGDVQVAAAETIRRGLVEPAMTDSFDQLPPDADDGGLAAVDELAAGILARSWPNGAG